MKNEENKSSHLPLYGVGPAVVYGQFAITAVAIILSYCLHFDFGRIDTLNIPFKVLGIVLIVFGLFLDLSAKLISKLFKNVEENKLITDGVYKFVRNPVYSSGWLGCVGAVLIVNNLV